MSKDEIIAALQAEIAEKDARIAAQDAAFEQLQFRLAQLERLIFGAKSEKFRSAQDGDPEQLELFATGLEDRVAAPQKEHISYSRDKPSKPHPGRQPLPGHLPVEEIIIEPEEDVTGMVRIGEEVTDTLDYQAASLKIIRRIRPKYAHPSGEGVVIGQLPERPLPKCIAEAGLLTEIIIAKFVDHLPFYRQVQRFQRDFKLEVAESTINDWFVAVCTLMHPLYEALQRSVVGVDYLQVDESPLKVLDQDKPGSTHLGYQWVYHAPTLHRVLFQYRKGRGSHGLKETLGEFRGHVQCDGWSAYEKMVKDRKDIRLLGCVAHARRKYFDAKKQDARANEVLEIIQRIYAAERELRHSPDGGIIGQRRKELQPLFDEWKRWMDANANAILPKSGLGAAVTYTQHQWGKLTGILEDERFLLDNNLIENAIRPMALGRKNYLFAGSHAGAQRIAMMYSFLGSCKMCGVNPTEWLKSTLEKLPSWPVNRLEELLPRPS